MPSDDEYIVPDPPTDLGHTWWPDNGPYSGADSDVDYQCNKCGICIMWDNCLNRWAWGTSYQIYFYYYKSMLNCNAASMDSALS